MNIVLSYTLTKSMLVISTNTILLLTSIYLQLLIPVQCGGGVGAYPSSLLLTPSHYYKAGSISNCIDKAVVHKLYASASTGSQLITIAIIIFNHSC